MISNGDDRLGVLRKNYQDADDNEGNDLSKATTKDLVRAIQRNWSDARDAYIGRLASELSATTQGADNAYRDAQTAVEAVKVARANSEQIADLIKKMQKATAAAELLVKAAAS